MKPVRRSAYALLFMLSLLVSLIVSPGVAKAWSGYLPQCGNFPTTWMSAIESDPRFNADTAWVAFKRDWSGPPFRGSPALVVAWSSPANPSHHLSLVGNGVDDTTNGLRVPFGASLYRVFDDTLVDVTSNSGGYSYTTTYDVNCVQDTHQIQYIDWVGYRYSDSVANSQGTPKYVALGDSFSSGEGNSPFEYGSDVSNENECHRSSLGYPRLLQNDPNLNVGVAVFVACSGATTANVQNGGQWSEPAQLDALTSETEVVTLTIGGNDVGFSNYVLGCVVACGPGTPIYNAMMDGIDQPAFKANLVYTFEEILDAAPNADRTWRIIRIWQTKTRQLARAWTFPVHTTCRRR